MRFIILAACAATLLTACSDGSVSHDGPADARLSLSIHSAKTEDCTVVSDGSATIKTGRFLGADTFRIDGNIAGTKIVCRQANGRVRESNSYLANYTSFRTPTSYTIYMPKDPNDMTAYTTGIVVQGRTQFESRGDTVFRWVK